MSPTVILIATLLLASAAGDPADAAGWRDRSDQLFREGRHTEALEAARQARVLDAANPWSQLAWLRALAAVDAESARQEFPSLIAPPAGLSPAEQQTLSNALGFLALDLGLDTAARALFESVPAGTPRHAESQAGLAVLAARAGDPARALALLEPLRVNGAVPQPWQSFERDMRFGVAQREFEAARQQRNANAASRAFSTLDELRPGDPLTLRARADLAGLRGDAPARERALRDLLAAEPQAAGAATDLIDTLLQLHRPADALIIARIHARARLAEDGLLQALERHWTAHVEAALHYRQRRGDQGLERLRNPAAQIALVLADDRYGRVRIAANAEDLRTGPVAAGTAYGSSTALAAAAPGQTTRGVAAMIHWAPTPGFVAEIGNSPNEFVVENVYGALRWRHELARGPLSIGLERVPVTDSQLSYSGVQDPLTGRAMGGVIRHRLYVDGNWGDADSGFYGRMATSLLGGRNVEDNSQWEAGLGYWYRTAAGDGWTANLGANLTTFGYADNLSRFTLGHGGYFSPRRFISVGPTFDLQGRGESTSFRLEGGLAWQRVDEDSTAYFPEDAVLQALNGNLRYASSERDGLGARLAATLEWRISPAAIAGLRLEGLHGEDYEEIRLQVYARGWKDPITEPVRSPPRAVLPAEFSGRL